ncbi:ubiquinol-cytochrome c reductase cytochrome b subunit [Parafrigoribacterium mesophilum]|uniref:cytochrome bc1 complex cytochrome b subunit n=1 Tax=Parafrigoribacterium mesophilum TaxID=433646 RepID=UPI0031FD5AB7
MSTRPQDSVLTDRFADYVIRRTAIGRALSSVIGQLRHHVVPNHWSNLFGIVSAACFLVVLITGIYLLFFYTPASTVVPYTGHYLPLRGVEVSSAYNSTMTISFEVRAGLLIRQAHHWAGLLLPASLIMQLLTTFFTGGFRNPRRGNWVLLFLIFGLALVDGWSGYALPDDMLSGTGLRIVEGIVLGIPVVGTWASSLLFGGEFPGEIIAHLYPIHVAVVPVLLILLFAVHSWIGHRQRPPQFPGPGRSEFNLVGSRILPTAATRSVGLLLIVAGVLFLIAATVTVAPIWLYGPADPGNASAGSQPDWYTGFLDGALRLVPPGWEFVWLGRTWTLAVLVPLAVVTAFLLLVLLYPFIEGWVTGDHAEHHLLDHPRNAPTRTAIGVAGIVFYGVLWGSASADLISVQFHVGVETVVGFLQAAVLVAPAIAFILTRRICFALQEKDRELVLHGYETGRVVRLPGGEFIEVQTPLDSYEQWRLADGQHPASLIVRPDADGKLSWTRRLRLRLAGFFFENRMSDPLMRTDDAEISRPAGDSAGDSNGR